MEHSSAFDLAKGVFTLKDPKKIAEALKHSAVASEWRKSELLHGLRLRIGIDAVAVPMLPVTPRRAPGRVP